MFLAKFTDRLQNFQRDPSFYDASLLTRGLQCQSFIGMLPPCLSNLDTANPIANEQSPTKIGKLTGKLTEYFCVKNEDKKLEWILSESTRVSDIFSAESLKDVPNFKDDCKCCARYYSKGCFF